MEPAEALRRIAHLLEVAREPTFRIRAFRSAAKVVDDLPDDELRERAEAGTLAQLDGIGKATAAVIAEALTGETPDYLQKLEGTSERPAAEAGMQIRAALRGDLHLHSEWSDGSASIKEMATTARDLGHDYIALTDHSPRLTVANGLSAERLRRQLDVVAELNEELAPFRILTGIEVNINDDGTLDQQQDLLDRLDVVVASVHGKLSMPGDEMTRRMAVAISNPRTNILGHCTGRLVTGERGTRPESTFDHEIVFEACRRFGVAVEINSRPERLDPPKRLLRAAVECGCEFSVDSDAHAPGQLEWQPYGCDRAAECGVPVDRIINTKPVDDLLTWTRPST